MLALASAQTTVTLSSSVEQAGRQVACPGEEVTFTCTVTDGVGLLWIAEPHISKSDPVLFAGGATAGETRDPTALIHIVLDDVSQGSDPQLSDYVSTLAVRNSTALSRVVIQCSGWIVTTNNTLMVGGKFVDVWFIIIVRDEVFSLHSPSLFSSECKKW